MGEGTSSNPALFTLFFAFKFWSFKRCLVTILLTNKTTTATTTTTTKHVIVQTQLILFVNCFKKKLFCYCCCFLFLGCLLLYCTYTHSYLHTYSQVLTFHWVDLTWDLERLSVSTLTASGHVIPTANRLAAIAKFYKWVPKPCLNQSELTWSASIQLCR